MAKKNGLHFKKVKLILLELLIVTGKGKAIAIKEN